MASEKADRDPSDERVDARLLDSKFRFGDVSAFQRDLLAAAGQLEQAGETVTTSGMVEILAPHYSEEISRGRLSRNLDGLTSFDLSLPEWDVQFTDGVRSSGPCKRPAASGASVASVRRTAATRTP